MENMKQRVVLIGAKQFSGTIEGNNFDTCKLRVMMPVEESVREVGFNITEMNYGSSANYKQFEHLKYPVEADIFFAMTLKSGRMTTSISKVEILPHQSEKASAPKV